jgi:SAM-dependent methyltransferase
MRPEHLSYLVCPACRGALTLEQAREVDGSIESGSLSCRPCGRSFPIVRHVPRFVPLENYSSTFGFEWNRHARTQYDSYTKTTISETRLFAETKWPRRLDDEVVLEVGSGSGRFTEPLAATGAMIVSLDYSTAVDANYASNGHKPNVLIVQGDIYEMPVRAASFDKVLCIGVLQHTPDPERSFHTLTTYLRPGGQMTIDVYKKRNSVRGLFTSTRHLVRPLTKRIPPERLYSAVETYIDLMWPIARVINRIPRFGRWLNWRLLIADYRGYHPLSEEHLKEWATLDTFDIVSPRFDYPQTLETVMQWFSKAGLTDIEVQYGYNGIEGRGRKSSDERTWSGKPLNPARTD